MIQPAENLEVLVAALENELLACVDEDILAAPDALDIAQRMASVVDGQLRQRLTRTGLPARTPVRRDRRQRLPQRKRSDKLRLVDRVLVASPKARALVEPDQVATLSEEELDGLLERMRKLGILGAND